MEHNVAGNGVEGRLELIVKTAVESRVAEAALAVSTALLAGGRSVAGGGHCPADVPTRATAKRVASPRRAGGGERRAARAAGHVALRAHAIVVVVGCGTKVCGRVEVVTHAHEHFEHAGALLRVHLSLQHERVNRQLCVV